MMRALIVMLATIVLLLSCTSPCRRLAERTCVKEGEGSKICLEITMMAEKASEWEQAICSRIWNIVEKVEGETDH